eukprot:65286_1
MHTMSQKSYFALRQAKLDKMIASQFMSFDYVSTCPYKWGIDISTLSQTEKDIIMNCYYIMDNRNYVQAEKCALQLLVKNKDSSPYNFLCALCFTANSFWHYLTKDGKGIDMFTRPLPHNITYYRSNASHHYDKCIQIEPKNPIFLLQYAAFLCKGSKSDQDLAMHCFDRAISLLKDGRHQLNPKHYDMNLVEYRFQIENIDYLIQQYCNNNKKLNDLYLRYQRILQFKHLNESNNLYYVTSVYVAGYSRLGEYMKACHILDEYHSKYSYLPLDTNKNIYSDHICIYLETGQYEKAKRYVINIIQCLDKFERVDKIKEKTSNFRIIKYQMLFRG